MTTTTLELVKYYANLLIIQYQNKTKAFNTIIASATPIVMTQQSVQTISFDPSPTSGTFILSYNGEETDAINWNDSAGTIQTKLRALSDLGSITVTGSISDDLTVNFVGFITVAEMLVVAQNDLLASSDSVEITIEETDLTLPLAVQNGYDLETAVGVQLNILGKYAGVTRSVTSPVQSVILNDDDFRTLIKFACVQNNAGSSLSNIEENLNVFFEGKFIVIDYKNMTMAYIFSSSIGSKDFFTALIAEKLIPKPMGVGISVLVPPEVDVFFGYSTYEGGISTKNKPYNTYEDLNTDWLYLDYNDFIF